MDSVLLYLLDEVKLADYCVRRRESSRDQPVLQFMLHIYEECLSPSNFLGSFHQNTIQRAEFFKLKVLR